MPNANDIITLSIDLKKLDKNKFTKGEKGTYCDLVLWPTPNSEYGQWMVKQKSSKEEAIARTQTPILGNAKIRPPKQQRQERQDEKVANDIARKEDEDWPSWD